MTKGSFNTYKFVINDKNHLNGYLVNNGDITTYTDFFAADLLKKLDSEPINNIKTNGNKTIFSNDSCIIIVEDFEKLYEFGYTDSFRNHLRRIERNIKKQRVVEAATLKLKKGVAGTVLVGSLLAAILSATKDNSLKNNKVDQKPTIQNEFIEPIIESIPSSDQIESINDLEEIQIVDNDLKKIIEQSINQEEKLVNNQNINRSDEIIINTAPTIENNFILTNAYLEAIDKIENEREIRETFTYEYNKDPDMVKFENTKQHSDEIEKYAAKWGISSNLIYCMMAQESGAMCDNFMQIQFGSWEDYPITEYDFTKGRYQTIVLTNNPNKDEYKNKGYTCISRSNLKDPETNISVGCFLLRYSIESMDGHVLAGLQCYNYGSTAMKKVINETSRKTGISVSDLLANQNDSSFLDYTGILKNYGDKDYVKNVLTYYIEPENPITIKFHDKENDITEMQNIYIENKAKLR